ncbi:MAG: MFS transporter [Thermoplasmata archaeon]
MRRLGVDRPGHPRATGMPPEREPALAEEAARQIPRDVGSVSVTSLFSDWSYEMVLPVLPFFLAFVRGVTPFLVGVVSGASEFAQSAIQGVAGARWAHGPERKVRGAFGYRITTVSHGVLALAVVWPEVLVLRVGAWLGRGSRQPIQSAIVSNATTPENQGVAFGLEPTMDSLGAVLGTLCAVALVLYGGLRGFREDFALSVIPGFVAVAVLLVFVQDRAARAAAGSSPRRAAKWSSFPARFRWFLIAEVVFGLGYFGILLALLRVGEDLLPSAGGLSPR